LNAGLTIFSQIYIIENIIGNTDFNVKVNSF